ncbi:MAG: hypothetical protein LBM93_09860, partial [Oscillospiraceae bacterium]|nr:hypothetical protein [Oscillospiraceae bacterium]
TSKYFSGLIFALIMVFFTLIMSLLVCFILFPENIPSSDFIDIDGKLETIFIKSPLILIFLLILSNLFFTIIYYTVGFSSICFIKNRYLLMLLPFIVYIFFTIISQIIGIPALSPLAYIAPYELSNFSIFSYFICTTLLIVTITYMFINCYKKMKENIV